MKKTDFPQDLKYGPPLIEPTAFIAQSADIIGNVTCGVDSSIWYGSVLRGDINEIKIGDRTNIQDGCVLHLENDRPCIVGHDVTVGHKAILHGCEIGDGCLIGMGAIILNGVIVGRGSVVGAGALVTENTVIPPFTLWVGVPAKQVKELPESTYEQNCAWAYKYVQLAHAHSDGSFDVL